ncbi:MAG: translation initiation factor IF-3 [Limisphaerales bacterium]
MRVNGKIRAREVRIIGTDGHQLGVLSLNEALALARTNAVDLVEIAPNATPPVCRLVDYGKFRYEQSKKDKEAKRHQHANKVKEVQLSPTIDPHDFGVKLEHAVGFLCDEMKVKVTLKFRGREMAHQEFGFQIIQKFITAITPYGHPDAPPKLIGRGINLMLSPLPRTKRAKNPHQAGVSRPANEAPLTPEPPAEDLNGSIPTPQPTSSGAPEQDPAEFNNNPFTKLDVSVPPDPASQPAAEA